MKKKTISQITRSLLIDAGVFGQSRQIAEHKLAFDLDGKTYTERDEYDRAAQDAFEKWKSAQGLTPRDAFAQAVKKYGERYAGWKSPHGRPFPDHYFADADAEAHRIMKESGIA